MTDLEKVMEWNKYMILNKVVEDGDLIEWLSEEEVFFTPMGSVVPGYNLVYRGNNYYDHIAELYLLYRDDINSILATIGLEALVGKYIFQTSDDEVEFWEDLKVIFKANNFEFPGIDKD